jgi:hypothetical protein
MTAFAEGAMVSFQKATMLARLAPPFGFVGAAQYQSDPDSGLLLLGHRSARLQSD